MKVKLREAAQARTGTEALTVHRLSAAFSAHLVTAVAWVGRKDDQSSGPRF